MDGGVAMGETAKKASPRLAASSVEAASAHLSRTSKKIGVAVRVTERASFEA